jgi:mono/diheme cytochrome c family protein
LKHGEYLVTMAGCIECHTQEENGQIQKDKRFSGGREFRLGPYVVVSSNITTDAETGIGAWSEERFLGKFLNYRGFAEGTPPAASQANFTLMPWLGLSRLEEEDLRAIYAYLRTLPAMSNKVESHPPAGS